MKYTKEELKLAEKEHNNTLDDVMDRVYYTISKLEKKIEEKNDERLDDALHELKQFKSNNSSYHIDFLDDANEDIVINYIEHGKIDEDFDKINYLIDEL